jgi:hypothetical protein
MADEDRRAGVDVRREWRERDYDQQVDRITGEVGLQSTPMVASDVVGPRTCRVGPDTPRTAGL